MGKVMLTGAKSKPDGTNLKMEKSVSLINITMPQLDKRPGHFHNKINKDYSI